MSIVYNRDVQTLEGTMDIVGFRQAAERVQFVVQSKRRPVKWICKSIAAALELDTHSASIRGAVNELNNVKLDSSNDIEARYKEFKRRAGKNFERILRASKALSVTTITEFKAEFDLTDLPSGWEHLAFDDGYIEFRLNADQLRLFNKSLSEEPCDLVVAGQRLVGLARQSGNIDERFRVRACRNAVAAIMGFLEYVGDRMLIDELPDVLVNRVDAAVGRLRCRGMAAVVQWDPSVSTNPKSVHEDKTLDAYAEHTFALAAAITGDWATVYDRISAQLRILTDDAPMTLTTEVVEHISRDIWHCGKTNAPNWAVNANEVLRRIAPFRPFLPDDSSARQQLDDIETAIADGHTFFQLGAHKCVRD
ncbi:MAG: hypothetical protein JWP89_6923 [Schlesneria sp.]|nr:hypothetical protein [Schlesneria sp.]